MTEAIDVERRAALQSYIKAVKQHNEVEARIKQSELHRFG